MRELGDLEGALKSRQEQIDTESRLLESAQNDLERHEDLAFALTGYGRALAMSGQNDLAKQNYLEAIELIEFANRQNPGARATRLLAERNNHVVWLDAMSGRREEAWERSNALWDDWQFLSDEIGLDNLYTLADYSMFLFDRAWLLNAREESDRAKELLLTGLNLLLLETSKFPGNRLIGNTLVYGAYRFWEIMGQLPSEEIMSQLPDYQAYNGRTRACTDASRAVSKAVMLGAPQEAANLVDYLLNRGYRETGFMQICRKYYSCNVQ